MSLSRAEKAARIRRARGIPGFLPTAPLVQHINALAQAGWTQPEIADAAGIDRRTIRNILHGHVTNVHRPTAAALLALKPDSAPNRIPALGAMRRIQALAVMGWPISDTGQAAGLRGTRVNELMAGRIKRLPREQAEAVDAIFRKRCMQVGPAPRTRTFALRNGWVSALAWEDIDDPNEKPQGLSSRKGAA